MKLYNFIFRKVIIGNYTTLFSEKGYMKQRNKYIIKEIIFYMQATLKFAEKLL